MLNRLIGITVVFVITVLLAFPAFAVNKDDVIAAKRESLIAFWEEHVRNDSYVKQFEKTKEEGVYNFETTFFPYNGRLKLLNAVIDKDNEYYQAETGIIEVELMDATPDFYKKYAKSYAAWNGNGYYYYDQKQGVWFFPAEWSEHEIDYSGDASSKWWVPLISYAPLLILFIFFGFLIRYAHKQNKRVWNRNDEILINQKLSMKKQEFAIQQMAEEIRLLQQIADSLVKK